MTFKKLDVLKKIGRAGLNLAGVQAGAGKDKVRALEAEKALVEMKLDLARMALEDVQRLVIDASRLLSPTLDVDRVAISAKLVEAAAETADALNVLGKLP